MDKREAEVYNTVHHRIISQHDLGNLYKDFLSAESNKGGGGENKDKDYSDFNKDSKNRNKNNKNKKDDFVKV